MFYKYRGLSYQGPLSNTKSAIIGQNIGDVTFFPQYISIFTNIFLI